MSPRRASARRGTVLGAVLVAGCAAVLAGCAGSVDPGQLLMDQGDYGQAAEVFRANEADDPYDAVIKRRLGAALLRSGQVEAAAGKLEEARALDPDEATTYLLLGRAREQRGDLSGAIESYASFLRLGGEGSKAVKGKIDRLSSELILRQVGELLTREAEMTDRPGDNTIAVSDFAHTTGEAELASLAKGLAAVVITDLRKVEQFRVLEREKLGVLLRELELGTVRAGEAPGSDGGADPSGSDAETQPGTTGGTQLGADESIGGTPSGSDPTGSGVPTASRTVIDTRTAPRVGRLLSVRHFVQGFYGSAGVDRIQMNANVVGIDGSIASAGAPIEGPVRDVLYLEKGLVYRILAALGVSPTAEERKKIDELATRSYKAFVAYSRGLAYRDAGQFAEAAKAFQEAVDEDGDFEEAAENLEQVSWSEGDYSGLENDVIDSLFGEDDEISDDALLLDVAIGVGGGPAPDVPISDGGHDGPADPEIVRVGPSDSETVGEVQRIEFPLPPAGGRP